MTIPKRNADAQNIERISRTFFLTTKTYCGRRLFQVDRNAQLLVDVLRSCVAARRFKILDFVIMPDHLHVLLTVEGDVSVEKAMQFIKGGFSYRLKRELGYPGEVWQHGFSEVRVYDNESLTRYRQYIAQNPVRKGLAESAELFAWCFESLRKQKLAGAKAPIFAETVRRD